MSKSNISFSKEQLEYINSKYKTIISSKITPNSDINTIMYNAGVLAVITTIEELTLGVVPLRPH